LLHSLFSRASPYCVKSVSHVKERSGSHTAVPTVVAFVTEPALCLSARVVVTRSRLLFYIEGQPGNRYLALSPRACSVYRNRINNSAVADAARRRRDGYPASARRSLPRAARARCDANCPRAAARGKGLRRGRYIVRAVGARPAVLSQGECLAPDRDRRRARHPRQGGGPSMCKPACRR
jgi:hypothetical protein